MGFGDLAVLAGLATALYFACRLGGRLLKNGCGNCSGCGQGCGNCPHRRRQN